LTNAPYASLSALESYAESTYSTLLYLTLSAMRISSINCDHIASHIGKANGVAAVLRGLPLLAFPPPPKSHSASNSLSPGIASLAGQSGGAWRAAVPLPLDVMAEMGVKEEEVFRLGSQAPGLKDAVFKIATLANDHLITARQMLKNLETGQQAGHEFEHLADMDLARSYGSNSVKPDEIDQAFGAFMPAVSTQLWLDRLEKADFDIFDPKLRQREWKLPWKAFWAYRRKHL
jgi:NADH dehydrogenase [ubiquinone] 1 alpha subcomplex assembly factor 6